MTFVLNSFSGTSDSCKVAGVVQYPWGNQRAAIQLTGVINRKDFNINYNKLMDIGPEIGDEVMIRLFADGIMKNKSK
jgi:hypothetical protein